MYLYVIKETLKRRKSNRLRPCMLKIGISKNPEERLKALQTSNPAELSFLMLVKCKSEDHAREQEQWFHGKLRQFHIRGEWFRGDAIGRFEKYMRRYTDNGVLKPCHNHLVSQAWEYV